MVGQDVIPQKATACDCDCKKLRANATKKQQNSLLIKVAFCNRFNEISESGLELKRTAISEPIIY